MISFGAILLPVLAAWAQTPSAEDPLVAFTRLPAHAGMEISPSGRWVAGPCPALDLQRLCVNDIQNPSQPLTVPITEGFALTDFYFAGENHLLIRTGFMETVGTGVDRNTYPIDRAVVVDVRTSEAAGLMSNVQWSTSNAGVVSLNRGDPETVLVEMTLLRESGIQTGSNIDRDAGYVNQLYRVALDDGRARRLAQDNSLYRVVDADGVVIARVHHDLENGEFIVRAGERSREVLYEAVHGYERPLLSGFTADGGVVFETDTELGRGVFRLDPETGEITDPFGFSDTPYQRPLFDRYGVLWGFQLRSGDVLSQRIVDAALEADQEALSQALGQEVMIESFSDDRAEIVFSVDGPGVPPTYYIFEREKGAVGLVGAAYPELAEVDLPRRSMISYAASDGLTIPAVLTTPPGFESGDTAPLVVMPHGGPAARDGVEFDWWAQAVAAQGYLVLQPNFRGSDGYGPAFREAGFGEFGGRMIEDILDGARHLQAQGMARGDRFCLTGASYGGYASLMGAVHAPEEVACVIAFAPVTEPVAMLGRVSGDGGENALAFWEEYMGSRFRDREALNDLSVIRRASRLVMPVIVMHGDVDAVVPVEQSRQLARAMTERGNFTYIELPHETHNLVLPTSRDALVRRSLAVFEQTLGAP